MSKKIAALSLALAASLSLAVSAQARPFKVAPDAHTNTEAVFTSKATIVKFTGRTTKVEGEGEIDIDNPSKSPKGVVTVDVPSFDTGIPLRNDHMRGMIEADKYPKATFKVKALKAPKLVANNAVEGTVTGDLTFHGVTKTITAPVSLVYLPEADKNYRPGDWVAVSTNFKIKLSDYAVNLPAGVLGMKVADELAIQLDGMAKGI